MKLWKYGLENARLSMHRQENIGYKVVLKGTTHALKKWYHGGKFEVISSNLLFRQQSRKGTMHELLLFGKNRPKYDR